MQRRCVAFRQRKLTCEFTTGACMENPGEANRSPGQTNQSDIKGVGDWKRH